MAEQLVISEETIQQFKQDLSNGSSGLVQRTLSPDDTMTTIAVNGNIHTAFAAQDSILSLLKGNTEQEKANMDYIATQFAELDSDLAGSYSTTEES